MTKIIQKFKNDKFFCFACVVALFVFSITLIRLANTGITYDEAFTYKTYIHKNPFIVFTYLFKNGTWANNHILNSFFISLFQTIIPLKYNEILIRMPNLLFYVLYLIFSYKICKNYKIKYAAFTLLVLNYGVNEFFGLARGYGMACSFVLIGIYFYKNWLANNNEYKFLNLTYLFLLLSCYANTVSLIGFATIVLLSLIRLIKKGILFDYIKKNILFDILIGICSLIIIRYHFLVSQAGLPLYGDKSGFYNAVIISTFKTYGFNKNPMLISIIFLFIIAMTTILNCKKIFLNNLCFMALIYCIILIFLTVITKQMWITGRSLIPAMPILIVSCIEKFNNIKKIVLLKIVNICFSFLLFVLFFSNLNINCTREWKDNYAIKDLAYKAYDDKDKINICLDNETTIFYRNKIIYYYDYDIYK